MIETLIALVISALIVVLVLPMTSEGAHRNALLADREVFLADQARAETAFDGLLGDALIRAAGSADPQIAAIQGSRKRLVLQIEGSSIPPCGTPDRRSAARLSVQDVDRGGRLVCEVGGRRAELLRWQEGTGSFDYSPDGIQWQGAWPAAARETVIRPIDMRIPAVLPEPVLVRFSVRRGGRPVVLWIARAGDPSSAGQPL